MRKDGAMYRVAAVTLLFITIGICGSLVGIWMVKEALKKSWTRESAWTQEDR
jgi:hypothetical protein